MKFAKLFVRALLAVAFVQTGSALVQGEYEETGQCEVLLVLVCKNIQYEEKTSCAHYYSKRSDKEMVGINVLYVEKDPYNIWVLY